MITKYLFNIQLFAEANVQTTLLNDEAGKNNLSPTMKEYYDTELLENAKEELYFEQFGKVQQLPEKHGKKIQWRKFDTLGPALVPLEEGVTPDGNKINMTSIEAEVTEHGDYTTVSDVLDLVAVDDVILGCTEEHGAQAGLTFDTLTRDIVAKGTNVMWAPSVKDGVITDTPDRYELDMSCKLTSTLVNQAVTRLKKKKAPKINGKYIAIIHPSVSEDLRESEGWIEAHKYAAVTEIFNGEIGELHGVRFIESNQAPIFRPELLPGVYSFTVTSANTSAGTAVTVGSDYGDLTNSECIGKSVMLNGETYTIVSGSANKIILDRAVTTAVGDTVYAFGAGKDGLAVYGCIFFGRDAYGRVELSGGAMRMIIKALGSAGSADPLDQRQTVGWKGFHAAAILYEERLLRVEVCSSYSDVDEKN